MTAPNAPMSAEKAASVLGDYCAQHGDPDDFIAARKAVEGMAEREVALAAQLDDFKKELGRFTDIACRYKAERDALVKEVEALREGAERYRWLRENAKPDDMWYAEVILRFAGPNIDGFDSLDEIVDAARAEARDG